MKKLMVAFAAVAMVACAQAASISWNSDKVYDYAGTLLGSSTAYTAALSIFSLDSTSGTYTDITSQWSGTLSKSAASKSAYSGTASNTSLGSGTYYAKLVIQNSEWSYESAYAAFSFNATAIPAQSVNLQTLGAMASNTSATSNYGWTPVPEPTSGMLLLLGMAGLALRRRRA